METVRYLVEDVARALPLYRALGFRLVDRLDESFAIVKRAHLVLWLCGPGSLVRSTLPDGRVQAPGGWNRLVLEVRDLDRTVDRLWDHGAQIVLAPHLGPGGREMLVRDPSGNVIELFEPTPASPRPDARPADGPPVPA